LAKYDLSYSKLYRQPQATQLITVTKADYILMATFGTKRTSSGPESKHLNVQ